MTREKGGQRSREKTDREGDGGTVTQKGQSPRERERENPRRGTETQHVAGSDTQQKRPPRILLPS